MFVQCDWLILDFDLQAFVEDGRVALHHECEIWITWSYTLENGYQVVPLFISSKIQLNIDRFRTDVKYMKFLRYSVVEVNPAEIYSLDEIFSSGSPTLQTTLYQYLEQAAFHNEHM